MSHTNSTTNYSLPQFLGTDKPAWLGDINPAFSAIDTALKTANDNASTASTASTANTTAIGDLSTLTTTSKTNLVGATNEVNSNLGTVATQVGTNTGDIGNIKGDLTSIHSDISKLYSVLNLNDFSDGDVSGTGITANALKLAQNSDGSIFKLYGVLLGTQVSIARAQIPGSSNLTNKYGVPTGLYLKTAPDEAYQIDNAGYLTYQNLNTYALTGTLGYVHITVGTDGQLYIWTLSTNATSTTPANVRLAIWFPSSLYFNTNFGDNEE